MAGRRDRMGRSWWCRPAGVSLWEGGRCGPLDSRLRGNDVTEAGNDVTRRAMSSPRLRGNDVTGAGMM